MQTQNHLQTCTELQVVSVHCLTCGAPLPKLVPEEENMLGMGPGPSGKRCCGEAAGKSGHTGSQSAHGDINRPIHGACTGRRQCDAAVAWESTLQNSRDSLYEVETLSYTGTTQRTPPVPVSIILLALHQLARLPTVTRAKTI